MEISPENSTPATPDQPAVQSGLVDFADPVAPVDNKQVTPENVQAALDAKAAEVEAEKPAQEPAPEPEPEPEPENARDRADREHQEANRAMVDQFVQKVRAANRSEAVEPKPQPVPDRIAEQTRLEMQAGQRMNEHHANLRFNAPKARKIDRPEGTMTPVFRPADYVPDLKKGQGNVGARPVGGA